ncbi:DUF6174 domain-containing protein [Kangiella sp. HZ709]|uniref:DUF6174 domain-containing protein n=1 Tax=Kangiella sp. HZ709 TaxID=2666328 RepID=UPI0012B0BCF4|nr:DUF6174 domain-containing protein [Kangiella sp. HZ709]MRX27185.1 hypothetical protein [Kangiella sp. HZ709]
MIKTIKIDWILLMLLTLITSFGCKQQVTPYPESKPQVGNFIDNRGQTWQDLQEHKALWEAKTSGNYQITFQQSCFCPQEFTQPFQLTVANGKIVKAIDKDNKPAQKQTMEAIKTVEQVFAMLNKATKSAELIEVQYDSEFGYPKLVFIDHEQMMADEEVRISLSGLKL